jgi:predicted permease
VEDEIQFHLGALERDLVARGMSEREARVAARERFGDVEGVRRVLRRQDGRRLRRALRAEWWGGVAQDIKLAVRKMAHERAFSAAVIVVLALGIGATTAMFSAVDAALLRPLPFREAERLVTLPNVILPFHAEGFENSSSGARYVNITDVAASPDLFSRVAAYAAGGLNLSDATDPVRANAGAVTAGFFETLGAVPVSGRTFSIEEGTPGGPDVAILSYGLWQRRFGGGSVLGQSLALNGKPYTIVGVMPRGFTFPSQSELWIPMTIPTTPATFEPFRGYLPSRVIARVADGLSLEAASRRMLATWEQIGLVPGDARMFAMMTGVVKEIRRIGATASLQRALVGDRRTALLVLLGATGCLLLIACANVTNLLLSRAAGRRREIAVRAVLGATRGRVVRQLLTESVVLALAGAALGLVIAPLALHVVAALLPPALHDIAPPRLDVRVLGFATIAAVLTGITFGLWPALGSARANVAETMKAGGGWGSTSGGAGRARRVLVTAELALTLVLLIGAGLMLKSFQRLLGTEAGFRTDHVATLELSFPRGRANAASLPVIDAALDRLARTPGVAVAGVVNDLPLRGPGGISVAVEAADHPRDENAERIFARYLMASGGYFQALSIPLLRGRLFTAQDDSLAPPTAVINETLARTLWPGQDPVGRMLSGRTSVRSGTRFPGFTVIGVVGDIREQGLDSKAYPQVYYSVHAMTPPNLALVARGSLPNAAFLAALRDAVRTADPAQAAYNVRMMDDVLGASVTPRRTNTLLIAAFGGLALLLAAFGVYGVVAYSVARRMRELGIRAALGATGADLVNLVAGEMVVVVVVGLTVGLLGAWAASRVLESLLYGVSVRDAATFALAPLVLAVPVVVAALLPARRSLRLNPMDVIRVD